MKKTRISVNKCGTEVASFVPAPVQPPIRQMKKNSVSTPIIALVAVAAALIIVSVFAFTLLYNTAPTQTTSGNQTNVSKLNLNFQQKATADYPQRSISQPPTPWLLSNKPPAA